MRRIDMVTVADAYQPVVGMGKKNRWLDDDAVLTRGGEDQRLIARVDEAAVQPALDGAPALADSERERSRTAKLFGDAPRAGLDNAGAGGGKGVGVDAVTMIGSYSRDVRLVAPGDQTGVHPALDGGTGHGERPGEGTWTAKQSGDAAGRTDLGGGCVDLHTPDYATCVTSVNADDVEKIVPSRQKNAVQQNPISIGVQLRALLTRSGMTMVELAAAMGYASASGIQRYLSPEFGETGNLSINLATRFAKALHGKGVPSIELAEVYALSGVQINLRTDENVVTFRPSYETAVAEQNDRLRGTDGAMTPLAGHASPGQLCVYGTALSGEAAMSSDGQKATIERMDLLMGEPVGHLRLPAALAGRSDIYALQIAGDSMSPRFRDGETIVVDPRRQASSGQEVVVRLHGEADANDDVAPALVATLVRRTASYLELDQLNPPVRFKIDATRIAALHRVLTAFDLLGL